MIRKAVVFVMIAAVVLLAVVPARFARADSDQVLLVYRDKEEMSTLSNLITACGKQVAALDIVEYSRDVLKDYEYIVLQDNAPLLDALDMGKRVVCVGDAFISLPGIEIKTINSATPADLSVYTNQESVILDSGVGYIAKYTGSAIGGVTIHGETYPLCVETDSILYAPYLRADDLSAFAVGQLLNSYFGRLDGGEMYIMLDEVYPFDDLDMLRQTAKKLYENGIPFIVSVMPVYYNTDYPSFRRYVNVLRYMQSIGGSIILHAALETGNELVGDPLDVRMEYAYQTFLDNGVVVYDEPVTPYVVSIDALAAMLPQNELFITLPIDTVIKFNPFENEDDLDGMIDAINNKWLMIGDYRRDKTNDEYLDKQEDVSSEYQYRDVAQRRYAFLVDKGNQIMFVIVIFSMCVVLLLIGIGVRLYRKKFLKKDPEGQSKAEEGSGRKAAKESRGSGGRRKQSGQGKAAKR